VKPLPGLARSVAACAALALAGHTALLALAMWDPRAGSPVRSGSSQERLIRVSLRPAPPALEDGAEAPAKASEGGNQAAAAVAEPAPPIHGNMAADASVVPSAPRFVTPPTLMGMPDASLPEGGVRVNLLVGAGPDGQPVTIAIAVQPADAPRAYAEWAERSLAEARLEPDSAGPHCLQAAFETGLDEARWAWLPQGRAGAERCLSGRPPGTARPLPAR